MVALGAAIAVPTLLELGRALWEACAITGAATCVYTVIAFFFRPEPNTDNMGWGGGMGNDPFQSSDNVNRFLWRLSCILGPGRFTAEAILDVFALFKRDPSEEPASQAVAGFAAHGASDRGFDATQPIAPLDPNRFALSSANSVAEKIQRDSQRFTAPPAAAG
jgi:hypothetical protein